MGCGRNAARTSCFGEPLLRCHRRCLGATRTCYLRSDAREPRDGGASMALHDLELVPEPHNFAGFVLLSYSSGAGTVLVTVPRRALVALRPGLVPQDQDALVRRNLEAFKPIVQWRLDQGDVKADPNPAGHPLLLRIELNQSDIEQAIRRADQTGSDTQIPKATGVVSVPPPPLEQPQHLMRAGLGAARAATLGGSSAFTADATVAAGPGSAPAGLGGSVQSYLVTTP